MKLFMSYLYKRFYKWLLFCTFPCCDTISKTYDDTLLRINVMVKF